MRVSAAAMNCGRGAVRTPEKKLYGRRACFDLAPVLRGESGRDPVLARFFGRRLSARCGILSVKRERNRGQTTFFGSFGEGPFSGAAKNVVRPQLRFSGAVENSLSPISPLV